MHGCIISAYIRHLRSLKIRLVHPPKIISLCRHCHLIVSFVVISLCHLTVPFHCAISLCRHCHLNVSSVSSHCVVIVISICRHSRQHARPDTTTNITQITSLLSGTAVAGMASNLSYVVSWRAHSVGLLLHK